MDHKEVLLWILPIGLASWRIAHMLVYEYGPFGIFQLVRSLFGIRHTANGEIMTFSHRNVLNCVWCISVWVALSLVLLLQWSANTALIVTLIFAVASVPPLIELATEWIRLDRRQQVHIHNEIQRPQTDSFGPKQHTAEGAREWMRGTGANGGS